jgi:hypothetical protein
VPIFREVGDHRNEGMALMSLGILYADQGQPTEATRCLQRAIEVFRQVGDLYSEGLASMSLGLAAGRPSSLESGGLSRQTE